MISRVAENCYWLFRYVARLQSTARLLEVNRGFVLDVELPVAHYWQPLIIVTGERERFAEFFPEKGTNNPIDDGATVQEYLVWDERNPASIFSSLAMARENARQVREVISEEMWASINGFWHWMHGGAGRKLYNAGPDRFYARVRAWAPEFSGIAHDTTLHEEPFDFMRLGMLLERAGQTARTLDVKYHMVGPTKESTPSTVEHASWLALLNSCMAFEPFFKRHNQLPMGPDVAGFLLFERNFPRSVRHCVDRAGNFLGRIRRDNENHGTAAAQGLAEIRQALEQGSIDSFIESGLHRELTLLVNMIDGVCESVQEEFFRPPMPQTRVIAQQQSQGAHA